jgi:hypothetical protein
VFFGDPRVTYLSLHHALRGRILKIFRVGEVTTKDSMIQQRPAACQALSTTSSAGFLYVLAEIARSLPTPLHIDDEPSAV